MPVDVAIHPVPELAVRFAGLVEESSRRAIAERGRFSIAVPGGSAAEVLLPSLIATPIEWSKVEVSWVDERRVPPCDTDSSFRVARIAWLDQVAIPAGQ